MLKAILFSNEIFGSLGSFQWKYLFYVKVENRIIVLYSAEVESSVS